MIITMGILFSYVRHRFMQVLLGLGIDYAILFHARFDEEVRKGSLDDAVFMTVTRTGPAVMYAMLATSMGFFSHDGLDSPDDRSFGVVSIIGIKTCFWVSCIGMPTIALLVNYQPKQQQTGQCYAVGTDACDTIIDTSKNSTKKGKKSSFSYNQFLTNTSNCEEPGPDSSAGGSYCADRVPDRYDYPGQFR